MFWYLSAWCLHWGFSAGPWRGRNKAVSLPRVSTAAKIARNVGVELWGVTRYPFAFGIGEESAVGGSKWPQASVPVESKRGNLARRRPKPTGTEACGYTIPRGDRRRSGGRPCLPRFGSGARSNQIRRHGGLWLRGGYVEGSNQTAEPCPTMKVPEINWASAGFFKM